METVLRINVKKEFENGLQMADFYLFTPRYTLGLRYASTFVFFLLYKNTDQMNC